MSFQDRIDIAASSQNVGIFFFLLLLLGLSLGLGRLVVILLF